MTRLFSGTPFDRPPRCERCGKLASDCACPPESPTKALVPPKLQTAQLVIERRKKGKVVTIVRGLAAEANDLPALLTRLKSACGAGGTLAGSTLEIQGDQLSKLRVLLGEMGYRVRG